VAYPNDIDKFNDKLNKIEGNTYVIEEKVDLVNGAYESELQHDNISVSSLNIYTGSKLTGNKVDNYTLSTPSIAPWKKIIKIYSDATPLYITYETTGDTVEADDINKVQSSITNIENEVDRYKNSNDTRVTTVENNKAEKTYVDTELLVKADKSDTYTKEETDQRIQMVVNAAPSALDTLKEIADALNDDPNFAATITTELSKKVDKVEGKQLSTEDYTTTEKNKLAGIQDNANNYVHPTSHPATMITEDSNHRWTTDTEKSNWNDANSKKHTHENLNLLETITQTLIDGWNSAYSHISDAVKHITSDERTLWNTVSGKANANHNHDDRYYTESESDTKYATKDDLGKAGYGDMLKSTYDKDNDGIVDNANSLQGKKITDFAPSGFGLGTVAQQLANGTNLNNINLAGFYRINGAVNAPPRVTGDNASIWHYLIVISHDTSGGWVSQIAIEYSTGTMFTRVLQNASWTAWKTVLTTSKGITWNDLKGV